MGHPGAPTSGGAGGGPRRLHCTLGHHHGAEPAAPDHAGAPWTPGAAPVSPRTGAAEAHPAGTRFPYHVGRATIHWRKEVPATEKRRRRPAQYRLVWTDAAGERQEATSSSWTTILRRAQEISADLDRPGSAGDPALVLTDMFEDYFAVHSSRGWARDNSLYRNHIAPHIERKAVRDFRPMLVLSILQRAVDAGYARTTCLAVRGVMSKVAGWAQTFELLPPGYNPVAAVKLPAASEEAAGRLAEKRAAHIPMGTGLLGGDEDDPADDDGDRGKFTVKLPDGAVPSFAEARAGRTALVEVAGVEHFSLLWDTWELLGLRWGESIYLRPESLEPGTWNIHIDWQFSELDTGQIVRTRPKNNKTRVVVVPPPMRDPWMARAESVAQERAQRFRSGAEKNPYGLMFAGPQGGVLRRSNMNRRLLTPARLKAEWPGEKWQEASGVWRYQFRWGIHSLRHRFCSVAVKPKEEGGWGWDIVRTAYLAGHANSEFTRRRYVGPTSDVVETTALIVEQQDWTTY